MKITEKYNASQSTYKLVATYKGGYEDTMTAGIAAFRAKQQPHLIQIFDAGAATIINAKGATVPVADLMANQGKGFNIEDYISGVRYFYADSDGKMIGMPFNSFNAVCSITTRTPSPRPALRTRRRPGKNSKPSHRS